MQATTIFGNYELVEPINSGGMAEVFRARSIGIEGVERPVAIKRMKEQIAANKEYVEMFVHEAQLAAQLTHANILQVYELNEINGQLYIAMEFVDGKDLRQIVRKLASEKRTLPIPAAVHIAIKLCHALDYAHRKTSAAGKPLNLVHRDVSPQNVLVSFDGHVKLVDFGVAKSNILPSDTQSGFIKGKTGYMSPEQIRNQEIDHRTDIFSLGVTLYEMLTGTRLFSGTSDLQRMKKVLVGKRRRPRAINPNIPIELEKILIKALRRNRDHRYAWASEMAADLQAFLFSSCQSFSTKLLASCIRYEYHNEIPSSAAPFDKLHQVGQRTQTRHTKYENHKHGKRSNKRGLALVASTAALFIVAMVSFSFQVQSRRVQPISITTSPTQNITILVDGKVLSTRSPALTSDLSPGFHVITVKAENYRTQSVVVEHSTEATNKVHVELTRESDAQPPSRE